MYRVRLQKRTRLLKAAEFDQVFDRSVRSSDQYFTVLARPNGLNYPRLGLAISKRRARLAVTRNLLKRITRESFRTSQQCFNADYIVMAGKRGGQGSNTQLFQALEKHWVNLKKKCAKF